MDATFEPLNFSNKIVWQRTGAHGKSRRYAPIHDIILFYSRSNDFNWNFLKKTHMKKHVYENFVKDKKGLKNPILHQEQKDLLLIH